ncbi:hypothetical protein A2706_00065 [Candidatus Peribacteria bacterium RIFCSPHIGHO2_01_FULL_51_35]|nr:MAG: hypothetical protein A2706_00065 [Candidatus Peribacteria bacterium RIFCSPHIGHO2_01_FULL_51_35]
MAFMATEEHTDLYCTIALGNNFSGEDFAREIQSLAHCAPHLDEDGNVVLVEINEIPDDHILTICQYIYAMCKRLDITLYGHIELEDGYGILDEYEEIKGDSAEELSFLPHTDWTGDALEAIVLDEKGEPLELAEDEIEEDDGGGGTFVSAA